MDEELIATRKTWHGLAEHLLAGDLQRRTGRIGLRVTPGGFGQPEITSGGGRRMIRIDGHHVVLLEDDVERWHRPVSADDAARFAGVGLGPPTGTYAPETTLDPSTALRIDPASAAALAGWFDLVGRSLELVRRQWADKGPSIVQLWPEHFDVACTIAEVNLGGSPGDDSHPEPYLYVGPWTARTGAFWNEPWGASLGWDHVPDEDTAVDFLLEGLRRAGAHR